MAEQTEPGPFDILSDDDDEEKNRKRKFKGLKQIGQWVVSSNCFSLS